MKYDYSFQMVIASNNSIEIENIGEVALSATNSFHQERILIINTFLGETTILQFGPSFIDMETLPDYSSFIYKKMSYDQRKLDKLIDDWINDPKFGTVNVEQLELEDALSRIKDFRECVKWLREKRFTIGEVK